MIFKGDSESESESLPFSGVGAGVGVTNFRILYSSSYGPAPVHAPQRIVDVVECGSGIFSILFQGDTCEDIIRKCSTVHRYLRIPVFLIFL